MTVRLETEHLILRPCRPEDAEAVERYAGLWEVARMTTRIPHPYPKGAAAEWIASQGVARENDCEYNFAITLRGDGTIIGACDLRRTEPGNLELGYVLTPEHWGRGYATEAAKALVVYGFEKLGAEALQSGHFADNPASGRVLEKAGFRANGIARHWSEARQGFTDANRVLLTRQSWEAARERAAEGAS